MIILFEGEKYKHTELNSRVEKYFYKSGDSFWVTDYVGYFSSYNKVPVFFLPKIFVPFASAAGVSVSDLALHGISAFKGDSGVSKRRFLSKFTYIFYLSLIKFIRRNENSILVSDSSLFDIDFRFSIHNATEMEIVISIEEFYRRHKDLIKFKSSEHTETRGAKINWSKTVRENSPFILENSIVYTYLCVDEDEQTFEDELLVVYYSLLNHLGRRYGNRYDISKNYELITDKNIKTFYSKCLKILKKVKGKHFDDRYIKLTRLLLAYFELASHSLSRTNSDEKLMVRGYNIVFEDMVDLVFSDDDIDIELKNQKDGKLVDHLYVYKSLFSEENIIYIGDSKYYKDSSRYSELNKYKQFTYAKNVIQYNVDPFNDRGNLIYRDEITEGYNLTPNFFLRGVLVDDNISSPKPNFRLDDRDNSTAFSCQFENRVFDRDTLLMCSFDVNFLFILKCYISGNRTEVIEFRKTAREIVRDKFISLYNEKYQFYSFSSRVDLHSFINSHFKTLIGKIYRNSRDRENQTITLGLSKSKEYESENKAILEWLEVETDLRSYPLA